MVAIYRFELTPARLAKIPQADRKWLFFHGHVTNEINLLTKLMLKSDPNLDDPSDFRFVAASAQTVTIAKLLAGKQFEAGEVLRKSFFGSRVRRDVEPMLSPEAHDALRKLEQYFGDEHPLGKLKTNLLFKLYKLFGFRDSSLKRERN